MTATRPSNLELRPVSPTDEEFLVRLYGSTREAELALVPWDDAQREMFIRFQYLAQQNHYQTEYPDAQPLLVLFDGQAAGRLYVHRRAHEIRLLDYTLAPAQRANPSGTELIRNLMQEAAAAGKPLNIHLEPLNWAQALFEQLGFVPMTTNGAHVLYEWRADRTA
ncbi:MAG: GNAT family N-acetyltransferase [Acidobacteria bacterium]|nr:GNAT family N-acetyltransferase [Acidobacteriota bacterium]MBI3427543.1 GNAT family N-acetyltransferase [Acidobacteriota bacterium]